MSAVLPPPFDEVRFWRLVDASRRAAPAQAEDQAEHLIEALVALGPDEALAFQLRLDAAKAALYTHAHVGAATIVLGWCSDDAFDAFRSWVVSLGERLYRAVLVDPDVLAQLPGCDPQRIGEAVIVGRAAADAYENLTGDDLADELLARGHRPVADFTDARDGDLSDAIWRQRLPGLARRHPVGGTSSPSTVAAASGPMGAASLLATHAPWMGAQPQSPEDVAQALRSVLAKLRGDDGPGAARRA